MDGVAGRVEYVQALGRIVEFQMELIRQGLTEDQALAAFFMNAKGQNADEILGLLFYSTRKIAKWNLRKN